MPCAPSFYGTCIVCVPNAVGQDCSPYVLCQRAVTNRQAGPS